MKLNQSYKVCELSLIQVLSEIKNILKNDENYDISQSFWFSLEFVLEELITNTFQHSSIYNKNIKINFTFDTTFNELKYTENNIHDKTDLQSFIADNANLSQYISIDSKPGGVGLLLLKQLTRDIKIKLVKNKRLFVIKF